MDVDMVGLHITTSLWSFIQVLSTNFAYLSFIQNSLHLSSMYYWNQLFSIPNLDNLYGNCCGKSCGGYMGGRPAIEYAAEGYFDNAPVTEWQRGQQAEVYAYAYRLCKVSRSFENIHTVIPQIVTYIL